jgi:hypothetical protein
MKAMMRIGPPQIGHTSGNTSYAHPACEFLEYIPWTKDCFLEPADVVDGYFKLMQQPAASTTPTPAAWARYSKPVA